MPAIPNPVVTWSVNDTPTDVYFNSNIRTAINLFTNRPNCLLRNDTNLSVPNVTWTLVTWDIEVRDSEGLHGTANPSRIIAVTPGRYNVAAQIRWAAQSSNTGGAGVQIRLNSAGSATGGTAVAISSRHGDSSAAANPSSAVNADVLMNAGDYVECFVWHSVGSTTTVNHADDKGTQFSAVWVSQY